MADEQEKKSLTEKQEKFCQEYLIDLNATQAAIRAGYSENTSYSIGWENLRKPEIQTRIQDLRDEMAKGFNITKERIIEEYRRLAFFDIRKIHTADGGLKSVTDFDDDSAAAVAGIEVYEEDLKSDDPGEQITIGRLKKIKLANKKDALDSLCKVLGYNPPDKKELTGKDGTELFPQPIINYHYPNTVQKEST
jgi:phage terminase small subunit